MFVNEHVLRIHIHEHARNEHVKAIANWTATAIGDYLSINQRESVID